MKIALLDIGGTYIKFAAAQDEKPIEACEEYPTEGKKGGPHVIDRAIGLLEKLAPFDGIGVSTAGLVKDGYILYANENLPNYTGMNIKKILQEKFGVPVAVENDVCAAALGEAAYGRGRENPSFLCMTFGTGIGGALIHEGKLITQGGLPVGSFGHMITHKGGRLCSCGNRGCLEAYASTSALVQAVQETTGRRLNGREIFTAFYQGEQKIQETVREWMEEIVCGLFSIIHILNPPCIVLGGGIMNEDYIIDYLKKELYDRLIPCYQEVQIIPAQLGNRAGLMGARYLTEKLLTEG